MRRAAGARRGHHSRPVRWRRTAAAALWAVAAAALLPRAAAGSTIEGTAVAHGQDVPWKLDLPSGKGPFLTAVLLSHGASATADADTGRLPLYCRAAAAAGAPCLRLTLRVRSARARAQAAQALMAQAGDLDPSLAPVRRWFVGGHSLGVRVAVRVAASVSRGGVGVGGELKSAGHSAVGLLLSSYPLKTDRRGKGAGDLVSGSPLPLLFLRGTADPLSPDLGWERLRKRLTSASVEVTEVAGGDHSLRVKDSDAAAEAALDKKLSAAVEAFVKRQVQAQ